MKARPNQSGEKLIRDYLARVTEAGLRYLPKGSRMAFIGRTRARIERECGRAGLADPAKVREVLAGLGEPEELVLTERARIDAEWIKRRTKDPEARNAVTSAPPAARLPRKITSRWNPATDTQQVPGGAPPPAKSPFGRSVPGRSVPGRPGQGRPALGRSAQGKS